MNHYVHFRGRPGFDGPCLALELAREEATRRAKMRASRGETADGSIQNADGEIIEKFTYDGGPPERVTFTKP